MKKMYALFTAIVCLIMSLCSFSSAPVSALTENLTLTEEELAVCEEYIAAEDRLGLYEYLVEIYNIDLKNALSYLEYWMTLGTGEFVLDDDGAYNMILEYYIYHTGDFTKPLAPSPTEKLFGDANMDGKISLHDIINANKIAAGIVRPFGYEQAILTDVDGTGIINGEDVKLIMQNAIGLISIDGYTGEITYLTDTPVYYPES